MLLSSVPHPGMALMWHKLKFMKFQCIPRKQFFTMRKAKHWQMLSIEVSISLVVLKVPLHMVVGTLLSLTLLEQGLTESDTKSQNG